MEGGSGDGVFISRDETKDAYELGSPWYYILNAIMVLYGLCYVATGVLVENAYIPHTLFFGNVNGLLYSERFSSRQAIALALESLRLFTFCGISAMLTFRKTRCGNGRYAGCTIFWVMFLMMMIAMDGLALAINSYFFWNRNSATAGNQGNPANHHLWCCAPEVYSISSNGCRPTSACALTPVGTVAELPINMEFLWVFATNIAFVLVEMFVLFLPIGFWLHSLGSSTKRRVSTMSSSPAGTADDAQLKLLLLDSEGSLRKRKPAV